MVCFALVFSCRSHCGFYLGAVKNPSCNVSESLYVARVNFSVLLLVGVNTWSCIQFTVVFSWISWRRSPAESSHWFRYKTTFTRVDLYHCVNSVIIAAFWIQFRLCVLTHRCLNGTAPQYLAESVQKTADVDFRRHLRSAATSTLIAPSTFNSWWQRLPGGGCSCVECSIIVDQSSDVTAVVSPGSEDSFVQGLLSWLTACCDNFCKVPLQHFFVKRHFNLCIYNNNNNVITIMTKSIFRTLTCPMSCSWQMSSCRWHSVARILTQDRMYSANVGQRTTGNPASTWVHDGSAATVASRSPILGGKFCTINK